MTVTVKDRYGKMCIVLRSYVPNEKKWTFRWLFSNVFPLLLPRLLLSQINIVISDGDSSKCNEIDNALKHVISNVLRVHCGWHLVNRGWEKY